MRRWRTGNHLRPFWQCWHCGVGEGLRKQIYKMHKENTRSWGWWSVGNEWLWHLYEISRHLLGCMLVITLLYFVIFDLKEDKAELRWTRNADVLPPRSLLGEVDAGRGSPHKEIGITGRDQKLLSAPPNFEKIIALAFFKATSALIPYWVFFTFKVQNPIYILWSLLLSK